MLYVYSNTKAIFEAQFRKKLNKTEAELKKRVAYKRKAEKLVIIEHIIRSSHLRFCKKSCSEKSYKFYKKPPVLESLFNNVTDHQVRCSLLEAAFGGFL